MIPITKVVFGPEHESQVLEVLKSGQIAQGSKVAEFEKLCASMAGTRSAVAVNNGTTALVLALRALGIGDGDEVITSPFTFAATLNAIIEVGATARFGDIDTNYNLDPSTIEPLINERTKAIMPVHLYGLPAQMNLFQKIANDNEIFLIEDAAQAHFATTTDGKPVGSYGLGCFSFYATKNLTSGEGGVVTVNDPELEESMRTLRNQGMKQRYQYEVPGYNFRMTDLAAAVAIPQFDKAEEMVSIRQQNALKLSNGLQGIEKIVTPESQSDASHVWHQYTIRFTEESDMTRDELATVLQEENIGFGFYYPRAVYDYDCYRNHPRVLIEASPNAESFAKNVISLPVHPHLSDSDLDRIVSVLQSTLS
tara:strand:+ start:368 stop:1465 length:1098 start_codon:yes stop_codon:yes gene_type:complete